VAWPGAVTSAEQPAGTSGRVVASGPAVTEAGVTGPAETGPVVTEPAAPVSPPARDPALPVRFASYNLLDLFESDSPGEQERYGLILEVIGGLGADVLSVQEIRAAQPDTARARLRKLAADTGMECVVPSADDGHGRTALATGGRGYHQGLMWRPGIAPVPGSFRESPPGRLWHGAGWLSLDFGGVRVRHGTFHATPFVRRIRTDQNELLLALINSGPDRDVPMLMGADWNTESADLVADEATGTLKLYEPADPYAGVPWFEGLIHQCEWSYDLRGRRQHRADRGPGDVLFAGGLLDAAAVLRAPWQATVGYYPGDGYGARGILRRIDAIRVQRQVVPALQAYQVCDTEIARRASDHLPISVDYVPAAISPPGAAVNQG
jgi:endonuclease/exonuclease/phosphatase family metal-dependent hydrolase